MNYNKITQQVKELTAHAAFILPNDIKHLLEFACHQEKNQKIKTALGLILENAAIAAQEKLAICQDTGLPIIFIEVGKGIKFTHDILAAIKKGVEDGYVCNSLRASSVEPITRGKSTYAATEFHIDFNSEVNGLKVTVLPKGFGSENKSRLKMFNPTADIGEIENFIVESVKLAGPESCPPFFIGVGIGSTSDGALLLAKKALLGHVDRMNELELEILHSINKLGVGVMGLGGVTALSVKIKEAPTHIAGLPVAVNISCHALRWASAMIEL